MPSEMSVAGCMGIRGALLRHLQGANALTNGLLVVTNALWVTSHGF